MLSGFRPWLEFARFVINKCLGEVVAVAVGGLGIPEACKVRQVQFQLKFNLFWAESGFDLAQLIWDLEG
jgi:hypothetical protein